MNVLYKGQEVRMQKELSWIIEEKYGGVNPPNIEHVISRLKRGEPVDHIIGRTLFLDTEIGVGPDVLIPRVETEYWVENAIQAIRKAEGPDLRILDMCAGSGCIGIALLKHLPSSEVVFADIEEAALARIKRNLHANNLGTSARHSLVLSDLFERITGTFEYIFANPPYIALENAAEVESSVLQYEPKRALFAPEKGLYCIKKILETAPIYLKKEGVLFIEIGTNQKEQILTYIEDMVPQKYARYTVLNDQFERPRLLKAIRQ